MLPAPKVDTTSMWPPSCSQILLQIERPTPLLVACFREPASTRLNGSNALATASLLMPIPVSLTVIWIVGSSYSTMMLENTLMTPDSWNFAALLSKFKRTYWTLLLSKYNFFLPFLQIYLICRFCEFSVKFIILTISAMTV